MLTGEFWANNPRVGGCKIRYENCEFRIVGTFTMPDNKVGFVLRANGRPDRRVIFSKNEFVPFLFATTRKGRPPPKQAINEVESRKGKDPKDWIPIEDRSGFLCEFVALAELEKEEEAECLAGNPTALRRQKKRWDRLNQLEDRMDPHEIRFIDAYVGV